MRKALRYRLFGMGKMPEALAAAAASPDVLLASEGLAVRNRVWGLRIPGARVSSGSRSASGAIVILPGRLLASIGTYVIADIAFGAEGGSQLLELSEDGIRIKFEVPSVVPDGTGTVQVHYRIPLDSALLSQVPSTSFPVALTNAWQALLYPWHNSYVGGKAAYPPK